MATNNVPRGANRAGANAKRLRAGQTQRALPPRSENAKAAHVAEVEAARVRLAAHQAEAAQRAADALLEPAYATAAAFVASAERAGWKTQITTGYESVAVLAVRGDERLMLSWIDGEPYRRPLHTDAAGHNTRLQNVSAALQKLDDQEENHHA